MELLSNLYIFHIEIPDKELLEVYVCVCVFTKVYYLFISLLFFNSKSHFSHFKKLQIFFFKVDILRLYVVQIQSLQFKDIFKLESGRVVG